MIPAWLSLSDTNNILRIEASIPDGKVWMDFDKPECELPRRDIQQGILLVCLRIFDLEFPGKRSGLIFDKIRAERLGNTLPKAKLKQLARLEELSEVYKSWVTA